MIQLGKKGKDKITGFEGIIISRVQYLFGCDQYGVAPAATQDGKVGDTIYFDEGRIEITGPGVTAEEVKADKPGGITRDCPGKQV